MSYIIYKNRLRKVKNMNYILSLKNIEFIVDLIKIIFIVMFTYCVEMKIANEKDIRKRNIIIYVMLILISFVFKIIKEIYGYLYGIICVDFLLAILFSKVSKNNFGYSILITTISLSINYILFFISIGITFVPNVILDINNNFLSLTSIIIVYSILIHFFLKIKRLRKGITFIQKNLENGYTDIIILNISVIILFCIISLSDYKRIVTSSFGIFIIIFSIIMFITIQKSLQLYYKQKLQEREMQETKEELAKKKQEIKELEKENLKLSKTNHSISHKQKSLKYELEQLILKNEIANENEIKEKIENLSKEMQQETVSVELTKTNIDEVDNMLKYMQSECIKNEIDFQLQVHGNIHHMTNKYIEKSDLEILLADHIKNAIIAINHSENVNKSILVRLGLIDGFYSLYIYDSGIEFEIETLINLGNKPSTTHADDGGTGMGFMNTFDTLRKSKASLIIEELGKPTKDNFTKVVKIIFDNKNEYKISSYREKEIQEKDKVYD